jgi:hypothetical protein
LPWSRGIAERRHGDDGPDDYPDYLEIRRLRDLRAIDEAELVFCEGGHNVVF